MIAAVQVLFCAVLAATTLGEYAEGVRSEIERGIDRVLKDREGSDRLVGTVSLLTDEYLFLQGEKDAMKVVRGGTAAVEPGSRVEVVGRPSLEGGRVVFLAEEVKTLGRERVPAPVRTDAAGLMRADDRGTGGLNWRRIELKGRAMGLTEAGFAMDVEGVPVTVLSARLPEFMRDSEQTRPDVCVTCVVELVLDQSTLFGRRRPFIGVKAYVETPADIVLVPDLRYRLNCREKWTRLGFLAVLAALCVLLLVLGVFLVRQARHQLRTSTLMRERKRMADDLHDTIEQHLVGAGMLLQVGQTKEAREILVRAKREMRDIVWGLKNDDMMRLGPAEMIREYARQENTKGVCRLETKLSGLPEHLDASAMRDLSLIIREAVGNAVKHGGAKKIALTCDPLAGGGWILRIANDGKPFDEATAPGPADGHYGLEGMRARARRLRAELRIVTRERWTIVELERVSS